MIVSENKLKIYCLKYAESVLAESLVFAGGNNGRNIPISFAVYLIQSNERYILIDAGCDNMPEFQMKKFYSPAFVLRQVDICADDITDVIITHAHHDHIEALKHFKNAIVHISKSEFENGKHYIPKNKTLNVFNNEFIIDPRIKIIECGGHSKGSAIVEIKADSIHIFAGDECYTNTNIAEKIRTGSSCNQEKSAEFIEKYSNKKYRVHTCHDISLKTERIL